MNITMFNSKLRLTILCIFVVMLQGCSTIKNNSGIFKNTNPDYSNAETAFKNRNFDEAADLFGSLTQKYPENSELLLKYAESLRLVGKSDAAIKQYDASIAKDENNVSAIEGKGLAYLQQGNLSEALNSFNLVVEKDASRWRTLNAIAVIYSINGNDKEALNYFDMALSIANNNPSIINNIALVVAFSGDTAKAISLLKKAQANTSSTNLSKKMRIENNMALVYGISGKMDEAEKILRKNLSEAAVYNNLGLYAKIAADKKLAWAYLSKAIASSPVYYEKAENNIDDLKNYPQHKHNIIKAKTSLDTPLKAPRGKNKYPLPTIKPEA